MAEFGKYDLLRKIGTGGMAEVFLARSFGAEGLEKLLVIKKILPSFSKHRHFVSMFIDEAKIAVTLSHPNLVQVFEFGQVGRDYYLAMEHVEGVDLGKLVSRARRHRISFPEGEAVFIAMELAKGLDYAHRKKDPLGEPLEIVHRDVSPQNLLIAREGAVKIVDFGIAKARSITEEEGIVKGKFAYMAPEQARGKQIDHRSDLYAVGVILYELLVGKSPYGVPGAEVKGEMVVRASIPNPRSKVPTLSKELEAILLRALTKEQNNRYQSARELQLDLTRYLYSQKEIHDAGTLAVFYNQVFPEPDSINSRVQTGNHSSSLSVGIPIARPALSAPVVSDITPGLSTPGGSIVSSQTGEGIATRMVRKSVVAVYGAIHGFTDLRRSHGEEKVRALMLDYLRVLENIAFKSEAVRERVAEDGFILLLGLPLSAVQDPERAVRLAFDLLDATEGINRNVDPLPNIASSRLKTNSQGALKISIGISRAEVRMEAMAEGRQLVYEVESNSLDGSQSLAEAAGAGEILCGSEIWHATKRVFRFEEREGKNQENCYIVEGALSRAERIRERRNDEVFSLYGRDLAQKTLRDTFREMLLSKQSQALVIAGETGLGKTHLIEHFLSTLDAKEVQILRGACFYYDVDIPFSPLIDILRDLFGILEEDPLQTAQKKLETGLHKLFLQKQSITEFSSLEVSGELEIGTLGGSATDQEYEYILHSFAPLLGIIYPSGALEALDAEQRKMRTILSIQRLFSRLARRRAVVIVLEDLHSADSLSLEILEALAKDKYPRKILVLLSTRPTERVERLVNSAPTIEIGELDGEARKRLVVDILGDNATPEVVDKIADRAGGNPLFLREMAETILAHGDNHVPLEGADAISTTIWGVVAARMDELKTQEREVLRWASALGGPISSKLLEMIGGKEISNTLPLLVERGFLARDNDDSYTFRNEITQTVAYDGIPPEERKGIHARIYQALLARRAVGAIVNPAHLAHHASYADETQEAVRLYTTAADRARGTYSNQEALRLYKRALSLLKSDTPERFPIHLHRSRILSLLGNFAECEVEVSEMIRLAQKEQSASRIAQAHVELARLEADIGRRPQAQKALEVALRSARSVQDISTEAEAVRLAAQLFSDLGDIPRGLTLARRSLEILGEDSSRKRLRASALKTLGILLRRSGDVEAAIAAYTEAVPLAKEANDRALLGLLYNNLGVASQVTGRYEDSLRYYKQGLAIDQEIGNRPNVGMKLGNIGQVYLKLGDFTRALKYLQQAQRVHETVEESFALADALTYLSQVFLRLTAPRDARAYAEKALEVARKGGNRYLIGHALAALAECLLSFSNTADKQRAQEIGAEAAQLGKAAPMPDIHAQGLRVVACAQTALGKVTAAREAITNALAVVKAHPFVSGEEEVYLQHGLLFLGANDEIAQASLTRAYEIVQERAERLSDPLRRRSFLEAPPNRDIIASYKRLRIPKS